MRQRFTLFGSLIFLIVLLIVLNAASFVQKARQPDTEAAPDRSSYNSGATGTRAFYTILEETGRKVTRWQQPPENLKMAGKNKPSTFIVIGPLRRPFDDNDVTRLLEWVKDGGRLVVIDRDPPPPLVVTTAEWDLAFSAAAAVPGNGTDPGNQPDMTADTLAARPRQPTIYTRNVIAAQPSRYAPAVNFKRHKSFVVSDPTNFKVEESAPKPDQNPTDTTGTEPGAHDFFAAGETEETPEEASDATQSSGDEQPTTTSEDEGSEQMEAAWFKGPVSHLASGDRNLLIDVPYGAGEIVYLSDPFIVANGGIDMADNSRLAINIAASLPGIIAFDEYHHGYGAGNNRILEYFESTPVTAIFLQITALAAFAVYSQSRRFARPVPMPEPDRRSKLEYISAMAELQQRTRAYDLAIENIYADFYRRAARLFGLDAVRSARRELALRIAERIGADADDLEAMMRRCEDIVHGDAAGKREVEQLARRIREIEEMLKLWRSGRPVR